MVKKNLKYILLGIVIMALASAFYAIFTIGQAIIHSDTELSYRLFKSIAENGNLYPKTWSTANGEVYFFSKTSVNLITLFLVKNKILATVLGSAITFCIPVSGFYWLSKYYLKNDAWLLMIPMFSVFLCSEKAKDVILFQVAYCIPVIAYTFAVGIFYTLITSEKKSKRNIVIHSIIVFFMATTGIRYVAEYILPAVIALAMFWFLNKKNLDKDTIFEKIKTTLALIVIPFLLGYSLYKIICSFHEMNSGEVGNLQLTLNIDVLLSNLKKLLMNGISVFGFDAKNPPVVNFMIIVIACIILLVVPVWQIIDYKTLNVKEQLLLLFGILHNLEIIAMETAFNLTEERYILSVVYVSIIISSNYIYKIYEKSELFIKWSVLLLFSIVTLAYSINLYKTTSNWQEKVATRERICQQLLDLGVEKGYATYWVGYPHEIYSDGKIVFGEVGLGNGSLRKVLSNNDSSIYEKSSGKSCLIFTKEEYDDTVRAIGAEPVVKLVGEYEQRIDIEDEYLEDLYGTSLLVVFVFDEDICDKFTDGLSDGILSGREMSFNLVGEKVGDAIHMANGGIVYGPYLGINKGHYWVSIKGNNIDKADIEVISEKSQNNISYSIVSETNDTVIIDLKITGYVSDIQFHIENNTPEEIEFHGILVDEE